MKVVVNYTVPVLVAVDTEAGKVEWVTVIDEAAELNRDGAHADGRLSLAETMAMMSAINLPET